MITVSYSEIEAYRQCAFKHQLSTIEGWYRDDSTSALAIGTAWHRLLEIHYEYTRHSYIVIFAIRTFLDTLDSDVAKLLQWMYEGYVKQYGYDPQWNVQGIEYQNIVELIPGKLQLGFTVDLLVVWKDRFWIVDHKSCATLPTQKDLEFHEQFPIYKWALTQRGFKIAGSIYSAAKKKQNKGDLLPPEERTKTMVEQTLDQRFSRTYLTHSDKECQAVIDDLMKTAQQMYSDKNYMERKFNPDTCHWKCNFTEACLLGRRAHDDNRTRQYLLDTGWKQNFVGRYAAYE